VIFTSDNGGESRVTSNAPLRAGKSTTYEGGLREPLIVRWPGMVKAGSKCSYPTMNIDFYPTFAEIIGKSIDSAQHIDGVSIVPLLRGKRIKRDTFYWHYPLAKPHFLGGRSSGAIRKGSWKLIEFFDDGHFELYNLAEDISEKNDVSKQYPEKVDKLKKLLSKWRYDVGVQ
jgi:arylsulfatase A-like enzyme